MSGSVLLDTNIVIGIFAGESGITDQLSSTEKVCVPVVVLGELYYGARKSAHPDTNTDRISEFAAATTVLGSDVLTAEIYGEIKTSLRADGRPIPENDIWIAAVAIQHSLPLATRDHHFSYVHDLSMLSW